MHLVYVTDQVVIISIGGDGMTPRDHRSQQSPHCISHRPFRDALHGHACLLWVIPGLARGLGLIYRMETATLAIVHIGLDD